MALLDKSNIPEVASHIRNLKDVVELKLTVNPGYKPNDKADGYNDVQAAQYVCPVTGLEMSGRYRLVCIPCDGRFVPPPHTHTHTHTNTCTHTLICTHHSHTLVRFAFFRGCGCVLSEKALKEVPSETCHKVSSLE